VVTTPTLVLAAGALALLAGCAGMPYEDPYGTWPRIEARWECERSHGVWHASLAVCENPKP
jgi:hypothetical protein